MESPFDSEIVWRIWYSQSLWFVKRKKGGWRETSLSVDHPRNPIEHALSTPPAAEVLQVL
jgi:hypothetical protein